MQWKNGARSVMVNLNDVQIDMVDVVESRLKLWQTQDRLEMPSAIDLADRIAWLAGVVLHELKKEQTKRPT
jgi:hypothetical protein